VYIYVCVAVFCVLLERQSPITRITMVVSALCKLIVNMQSTRILLIIILTGSLAQGQQSPLTMNGGSVLAMAGKNCVAVAVDKRFGAAGGALVNVQPRHVFLDSHLPLTMVAFTGLEGDIQSLREELSAQVMNHKRLSPKSLSMLLSHILYNKRQSPYYVEPVVVGIHDRRPFLSSMDVIGAQSKSPCFSCAGAAMQSILGTAEAMWRPDLEPDELIEVCGKAFLSALERDCMSGYGAIIYLLRPCGTITEYDLASRND
jgi:20S proteasome subunit beta 3